MSNSRRLALARLERTDTSHAGLWLDRYIEDQTKPDETKKGLVDATTKILPPVLYTDYFKKWQGSLAAAGAVTRPATVQGRMAVGLGSESVLETSIALHRTYGVPYIPGSALKGLAARYARLKLDSEYWKKDGDAYQVLFGNTTSAGYVTFYDALYEPGSGYHGQALWPDVITVHHPNYYQGDQPPADWDSPTPIPFLTATGKYLLALSGPESWVNAAFEILANALVDEGIGAKTSSGYGRMEVENVVDPSESIRQQFENRLNAMPSSKVAGEIYGVYEEWHRLDVTPKVKETIALLILAKIDEAGRTKKSREKAWFQELSAYGNTE